MNRIEFTMPDGLCDAWLATPKTGGRWPALIFCMDAVGPRETLFEMAERLADQGYVVLLPNLFYRDLHAPIVSGVDFPAKVSDLPKILDQIMPLVMKFNPEKALSDMAVFIEHLKNEPSVRAGKFGIFGYCMGGALAIRTAARFPEDFGAVASFHAGGLVGEDAESPHRLLLKIKAALYVGHADQDPHMSEVQIREFDRAASQMTSSHESEFYLGAQHHFTMKDLPAFNAAAEERHRSQLLKFLRENL